jgi:hypothetical protein
MGYNYLIFYDTNESFLKNVYKYNNCSDLEITRQPANQFRLTYCPRTRSVDFWNYRDTCKLHYSVPTQITYNAHRQWCVWEEFCGVGMRS